MGLGSELLSQVFKSSWSSYKPGDRYADNNLVAEPAGAARKGLLSYPKQHVNSGS